MSNPLAATTESTPLIPVDIIRAEVERMYGHGALRSDVEAVYRVLDADQELLIEVYLQATARQKMEEIHRMQAVSEKIEVELFETDRIAKASTRDLLRMRELAAKIEHKALEFITDTKKSSPEGAPPGGTSYHQHVHLHGSEEAKELAALSRASREKLREVAEMLESGARNIGRQIIQESEPVESSDGG